jgi:hypothetical protein
MCAEPAFDAENLALTGVVNAAGDGVTGAICRAQRYRRQVGSSADRRQSPRHTGLGLSPRFNEPCGLNSLTHMDFAAALKETVF